MKVKKYFNFLKDSFGNRLFFIKVYINSKVNFEINIKDSDKREEI